MDIRCRGGLIRCNTRGLSAYIISSEVLALHWQRVFSKMSTFVLSTCCSNILTRFSFLVLRESLSKEEEWRKDARAGRGFTSGQQRPGASERWDEGRVTWPAVFHAQSRTAGDGDHDDRENSIIIIIRIATDRTRAVPQRSIWAGHGHAHH